MADYNGTNYAKTIAVPATKVDPGEINGREKVIMEEFAPAAILAIGDKLLGPLLPLKAKVTYAKLVISDGGGTGVADMGWEAGVNGVESADPNGLISGLDFSGGDASQEMALEAGLMKRFEEAVQLSAIVTTASTGAVASAKWIVKYVID